MKILFWILFVAVLYCYFGYPAIIYLVAKFRPRPIRKGYFQPRVSIVLSVWNEEDVIEGKIQNLLGLNYPADKMEILIGSDGSTDRTNSIVKNFKDPRVIFLESQQRSGKMVTINELIKKTKHEVIIFTDARQLFDVNAIQQLVANFADPDVGSVSGELIFGRKEGGTAKGLNLYWEYEKFIRSQESRVHSMLGATGAIYAIRRELFVPVPSAVVLDDMFIPFKVIEKGYRATFDDTAVAYDEVADSPKQEHRRKARTLYGNYQIFGLFPRMFNIFRSPIAIQLFSHKFLRVIVPFFMIVLFVVNALLIREPFYEIIFIMQIVFYGLAILGALARQGKYGILRLISKICYIPYVFCLLNFSALVGFLRFVMAKQDITWQKARD
jgi:cellulose synthase/poly-beta-1,6-N-acetylglucosamine synthase-like glycosyltransferase